MYVEKDTWRDEARGMEGEFYEAMDGLEGVAELYGYGVVEQPEQDGWAQDDTRTRVRKGLEPNGKPVAIDYKQAQPPSELTSTTDTSVVQKFIYPEDDDYLPQTEPAQSIPRNRVHSRLILRTRGWPIKYACSPRELISAMRDAIIGE